MALLYFIHRRRAEELLAVTLIVVSLVMLARTAHPFYARYLLPILPASALLVGSFLMQAGDWLARTRSARIVQACLAAAVVLLVWSQAYESALFIKYVSLPDTRAQAYEFILQRFQHGATIASEETYLRLPREYRLIRWSPLHHHHVDEFAKRRVDALVFSAEREPADMDIESLRARNELRLHFPVVAEFLARDGVTAGPTVSIHLGRPE